MQDIINRYIAVLTVMMMRSDNSLTKALEIIRKMSEPKPEWSDAYRHIASEVSWQLQANVAEICNLKRCAFCQWVIYNNEPHTYCDDELAGKHDTSQAELDQADADWEAYYDQLERETEEVINNKTCPCLHPGHRHEGTYCEGACLVSGCKCPQFGTDPDEYDPPKQVWFTESPSGHNGWE